MRVYLNIYAFRILQLGLSFLAASWSARLFGVSGRGDLAAAQAAVSMTVNLGGLGLPNGVTYFVARYPDRLPQILGSTVLATLGLAAIGCLVVGQIPNADLNTLRVGIYAGVAAQSLFLLLSYMLTGVGAVAMAGRLETYVRVVWLGTLAIWTAFWPAVPLTMLGLQQLAYGLILVGMFYVLRQRCETSPRWDGKMLREMLPFSLRNHASAVAGTILVSQNIFLVQHFRGAAEVGLFCSAALLGNLLCQLPSSFYPAIFRELSLLSDLPSRWRRARPMVLAGTAFAALGALLMAWQGSFLIEHIFGRPFLPALPALPWLLAGSTIMACCLLCQPITASMGQPILAVVGQFLVVAVDFALNCYWIPQAGFVGSAQITVITSSLWLLLIAAHLGWLYYRPPAVPSPQA